MVATSPSGATFMPGGLGWFGHLKAFRDNPLELVARGAASGQDIVQLRLPLMNAYVVYAPHAVREVLVENPERYGRQSRGSRLLRRTLGLSTLTAEGEEWRWRRRMAQPSFKRDALDRLDAPIVASTERAIESMLAQRGPLDVSQVTSALALEIACTALFGDDLAEDAPVVHRALTTVLEGFIPFTTSPIPNIDRLPLPAARRHYAARAELASVVQRIVARRKARGELGHDLLATWLSAKRPDGSPLTAEDLDAEGVTMLLAGHETTANAMSFALGLLARHPSVLRRLRQEVTGALGDGPATAATLDQMPLLDAVLREAMRLYPPAWILSRSAEQDTTVAGLAIAKGSVLFVPVYGVHRVPSVWEDPEAFDPDRWLDGRGERARKQGMYLPFGMGQRRCVGEHLALLEARLALATLVRKVHLALIPGQTLEAEVSVTLRPRGGLWMTAQPLPSAPAPVQVTPSRCPVHHAP
jgi:cytochrome P450